MKQFIYMILIGMFVVGCASMETTEDLGYSHPDPKPSMSAANVLGTIVNAPLALATHIVWSVWGVLSYPIAALAGDVDSVPILWSVQVGPTYTSTIFYRHWAYYGHEAETTYLKSGAVLPTVQPVSEVEIDFAFAPIRTTAAIENMKGNETRPLEVGE